jgi:hypothetical protein
MHQNRSKKSSRELFQSLIERRGALPKIAAGALIIILIIIGVQFRPLTQKSRPAIQLLLSYIVKNSDGTREGKLGDLCLSGDHIVLSVSADTNCWLMVFYVSIKEIPEAIFPEKLEPVTVSGGTKYFADFLLNDVPGHEQYYAVASHERFTFDELIPHLDTLRDNLKHFDPEGSAKGPLNTPCNLNLPEGFSSDAIYFNHVKRKPTMEKTPD